MTRPRGPNGFSAWACYGGCRQLLACFLSLPAALPAASVSDSLVAPLRLNIAGASLHFVMPILAGVLPYPDARVTALASSGADERRDMSQKGLSSGLIGGEIGRGLVSAPTAAAGAGWERRISDLPSVVRCIQPGSLRPSSARLSLAQTYAWTLRASRPLPRPNLCPSNRPGIVIEPFISLSRASQRPSPHTRAAPLPIRPFLLPPSPSASDLTLHPFPTTRLSLFAYLPL